MRLIIFVLLTVFVKSIPLVHASELIDYINSNCYGVAPIELCQKYLDDNDSSNLTDKDELYNYANAYEHVYRGSGLPEKSISILEQLASKYPEVADYYLTLSHFYYNYSQVVGDEDWWTALTYALRVVQDHPENQYGHENVASLLMDLNQADALLDSALVFSVKGFDRAAESDPYFINKLASASRVYQKLVQYDKQDAAEVFRKQVIERLDIVNWKMSVIDQYEGGKTAGDRVNFIHELCNGAVVFLDNGDGCYIALTSLRNQNIESVIVDERLKNALLNAKNNAAQRAPDNQDLAEVVSELWSNLVVES